MEDSTYIKRLKERLRQNPDTRLFLSLAEEMRKRDKMDEAIAILVDGIKRNPDFVAARLTLGRWYLSCNMFSEAKKEFLMDSTQDSDRKDFVKNRLNKFLDAIKSNFASMPVSSI